jgi:cytidine deaminase
MPVKQKKIIIPFIEYSSDNELTKELHDLAKEAKKAANTAYSPYSKFNVGAAILLENGKIISGSNQENSAYPSGLCAERVALFYANSKYPDVAIKVIAIIAFHNKKEVDQPIYPCGACRQVISESQSRQKKPIQILFLGKKRIHFVENASTLLPLEFDKNSLNK